MKQANKLGEFGKILGVILAFLPFTPIIGLGCGADEDLPGALPPAPHGGDTAELKVETNGAKTEEEAPEKVPGPSYHWEGVYDSGQKEVQLFLLAVPKEGAAVFTRLAPEKMLSQLEVKIELPREKKFISLPFSVDSEKVTIKFEPGKVNRFLVHIAANHEGKLKTAKIQIEEE